jgi:PleD family two-component response regulator
VIAPDSACSAKIACRKPRRKWPAVDVGLSRLALHLIGPLQSNKAKEAVALFDAIHSVDRPSIMANARKILIVDDDTDLRDTLVEQLSLHEEFEASAVDTGAKGASAAKANSPDLVLMDVGLPDTDGREVVRSCARAASRRRSSC